MSAPFQVIQERPRVNDWEQALTAATKLFEAIDLRRTQQMQDEFNNILLSEGDGPTKYKAIRELPQKWGKPINAIQGGSQLIGMEMQQSFDPAYQRAQEYRQLQVQALAQRMITDKQRADAYVKRQDALSDPYAGMTPEEKAQALKIKAGLEPRAAAERTDAFTKQVQEAVANKQITQEQADKALLVHLKLEPGAATQRPDAYTQQVNQAVAEGRITQEQADQSLLVHLKLKPAPSAAVENRTDTIRYFDKDKKMQMVQVPHTEYNAAIQWIQAEGGNLDTRQGKVDKFSDDYLKGMGFSDQEIPRVRRIGFGLEARATATGSTNEKELSNWLTQRKKTIDTWGEPINTPEMVRARELADKKIDEILTRIEQEPAVQSAHQPSFTAPNHDPLAYEPAPGSIVVPDATRQTEEANTLHPDQTTPASQTQATEGQELSDEQLDAFVAEARKKLGKYATPGNLKMYAKQLAKKAGYKVD